MSSSLLAVAQQQNTAVWIRDKSKPTPEPQNSKPKGRK